MVRGQRVRGAGWWCVSSHRGSGRAQLRIFLIIRTLHACVLSLFGHVQLCVTLWTIAHQAPLSMGLSRQEYWSGLPCPPPGDLPDPGIKPASPVSPALQADSLPLGHQGSPINSLYNGLTIDTRIFYFKILLESKKKVLPFYP